LSSHAREYWVLCGIYCAAVILGICFIAAKDLSSVVILLWVAIVPAGLAMWVEQRSLFEYMKNTYAERWAQLASDMVLKSYSHYSFIFSQELESDTSLMIMKKNNRAAIRVFWVVGIIAIVGCPVLLMIISNAR
jgi:hypothetical protein